MNSIIDKPKVSIVMSLFNSHLYLREAIDSILRQTLTEFELIIIDDGSTDDGADIVRSYDDERIILIVQKNKGLPSALNLAVQLAKSEFIARMDPDDICFPERISKQYNYMLAHDDVLVLGSAAMCIDELGEKLPVITKQEYLNRGEYTTPESPCIHPSVMFRRSAFEKVGGYTEKMRFGGEDAVLFNKIISFGKVVNLTDVLIYYRLSSSSMSQKSKKFNILLREVISKTVLGKSITRNEWEGLELEYQNSKSGKFAYHIYIAKLFWKKKESVGKSRKHLVIALKTNPYSRDAWGYLIISYFPLSWRVTFHSYLKSQRNKLF